MWIRQLTSFNAYDIRGELGVNFNTNIAYQTGYAHDYCQVSWVRFRRHIVI